MFQYVAAAMTIECLINKYLTEGWWLEPPSPMKGVIPIHEVTGFMCGHKPNACYSAVHIKHHDISRYIMIHH